MYRGGQSENCPPPIFVWNVFSRPDCRDWRTYVIRRIEIVLRLEYKWRSVGFGAKGSKIDDKDSNL